MNCWHQSWRLNSLYYYNNFIHCLCYFTHLLLHKIHITNIFNFAFNFYLEMWEHTLLLNGLSFESQLLNRHMAVGSLFGLASGLQVVLQFVWTAERQNEV